jgi:hypothetical protein
LLPRIWLGKLDGAHRLGFQVVLPRTKPSRKMLVGIAGVMLQHPSSGISRRVEQINVALNVRKPQQRRAGLARAQMFAGPANEQVLSGNLKAISRFVDDF